MKPNRIILILCCFAFSLNLKANNEIKLTWVGGIYVGQGVTNYKKNITITAPENETFTVDWGDGSNIETKTGTGDIQIINHTYADTKFYTTTIRGSSADCLFIYFDCGNNGVINLDMGANVSLKTLRCRYNWLTELDISHCTDLGYLDYSRNGLTELDISHCSALEYLDCSYNLLKELYISTNTALKYLDCRGNGFGNTGGGITHLYINNCELTYLDCSYNSLALSNLYAISEIIGEIENIFFDNQTLPLEKVITGTPLDFSPEIEFGGITTVFDIKREFDGCGTAIEGVDYKINEGIITFLTWGTYCRKFIVTLTNESIPSASVTASFEVYDFMHILSELTVSEGTFNPEFNSINFNYTVNVGEDVSEVIISATPNNPNTAVSGTGLKTLNFGENNFIIEAVTAFSETESVGLDYKIKIIRGSVGMTNIVQSSKIKIYPNPANHFVEIDFGNNFMQYQPLYVYDLMGKLCLTVVVTQEKQQINIQNLPAGNYIIQVVEKGKQNMSEKLLIIR